MKRNAMIEFINCLQNTPDKSYNYIVNNYWKMNKDELAQIVKELLYAIEMNGTMDIVSEVAVELESEYAMAIIELAIDIDKIMTKIDYEYPYDMTNDEAIEQTKKDIYNGEVENYIVNFQELLDEQEEDLEEEIVKELKYIIQELISYHN